MFKKPFDKHNRVTFECKTPSVTQQHMKELCDVNNIIKRWAATGELDHINHVDPLYMDCSLMMDYQEALEYISVMEETFDSLPEHLKDRFLDARNLAYFLSDNDNLKEAVELGILRASSDDFYDQPASDKAQEQNVQPAANMDVSGNQEG